MRLSGHTQRNEGGVLTEMLVAAIAFVILGVLVADYALSQKSAPIATLQTEAEPARLILSK